MHPTAVSPTPPTPPTVDKFIPLYHDFLVRQLRLLSLHPAVSLNKAGDSCLLHTFPGQSTDKPSPGLEHLSARLSHATVNSSDIDNEDVAMTDASSDGSSDEGFHEDMQKSWPPFGAEELYHCMNASQITTLLKDLTDLLPNYACWEVQSHINKRLHKDMLPGLPSELQLQILSYLDASDLKTAKCASSKWLQICTYPALWKSLYLQDGYSIASGPMLEFERRITVMQERIDNMFANPSQLVSVGPRNAQSSPRNSRLLSHSLAQSNQSLDTDLLHLYHTFFRGLNVCSIPSGTSPYRHHQELRTLFSKIASIELGREFYRSATFIPESNGSIRVLVDWHYIYLNRCLLEKNWRSGSCVPSLVDGAPDVDDPRRREGIYCVIFDHNTLAAGSRDNLIRIWDMPTLKFKGSLSSHDGSVLCLQLDSEQNLLISGSSDATIRVWDLETGGVVQKMCGHIESVLGLHFHGRYLASCSKDTTARIWRWSDGSDISSIDESAEQDDEVPYPKFVSVRVLSGHRAAVNSVHFLDDIVATASGDRSVRLWNLHSGAVIRTLQSHSRGIACVQLLGAHIITGSSDQVVKIMDRATGTEVQTLIGHTGLVRTIHTNHSKLVSGSYDQTIKVWDLKSGELLHQLARWHDSKIFRVHCDQRRIVSCCGGAKIVIWDFTMEGTAGDIPESRRVDAIFF